jgi:hypothetical protein
MKKKIILIILFSLVFIGMGVTIYLQNNEVGKRKKQIDDMVTASKNANSRFNKLKYTNDSLHVINGFLAKYRVLTEAMTYRDSMKLQLKYNVGDIVYLKRDSSRAVVSDVVMGGGKHEYYIKYKVIFKSGKEEEVVQELLY